MRTLFEGAARNVVARVARGAHAHCGTRRSRAVARTSLLIAAIVAGGAGRRFGGEPKGLRVVGGKRIIDRIAHELSAVVSELVLVANAPDAASWLPGARVIPDAWDKHGSLVGIHAALHFAREPVIVVAWDMPFVTRSLFELLRDRSTRSAYATIPEGVAGLEPFCAAYRPECLPFIEAQLVADDLRLSNMLARLPSVDRIPAADLMAAGDPARLFFNVNTLDDLATAERIASDI